MFRCCFLNTCPFFRVCLYRSLMSPWPRTGRAYPLPQFVPILPRVCASTRAWYVGLSLKSVSLFASFCTWFLWKKKVRVFYKKPYHLPKYSVMFNLINRNDVFRQRIFSIGGSSDWLNRFCRLNFLLEIRCISAALINTLSSLYTSRCLTD